MYIYFLIIEEFISREHIEKPLIEEKDLIYSQELNYDITNSNNDNDNYFDKINCFKDNLKCKDINTGIINNNKDNRNYREGYNLDDNQNQNSNTHHRFNDNNNKNPNNIFNSNGDWIFDDRAGRSIESIESNQESEKKSSNQDVEGDSNTLGRNIIRKIVDLDKIVVQEFKYNKNLLDMKYPLLIKDSVVKITKHNFIKFQNAEMHNLEQGNLEYLSLNLVNDSVYVEYVFVKLSTNGTFKTNLSSTKSGSILIDLNDIRSSVSASFHKGRHNIIPAKSSTITVNINAVNQENIDTIIKSVNKKYRNILEKSISTELYNSTFKGMVNRLKTEMKSSLNDENNERATKLYDMNWTEDNLNIQIYNIGGQSWKQINQKMDSMSYTRETNNTYKMRFDIHLKELQWTSDLTIIINGQLDRVQSLNFNINDIRTHIVLFKSIDNQECLKIEIKTHVNGLRYNLYEQLTTSIKSLIDNKLHGFIERSFEAYIKNALKREVCNNRI